MHKKKIQGKPAGKQRRKQAAGNGRPHSLLIYLTHELLWRMHRSVRTAPENNQPAIPEEISP